MNRSLFFSLFLFVSVSFCSGVEMYVGDNVDFINVSQSVRNEPVTFFTQDNKLKTINDENEIKTVYESSGDIIDVYFEEDLLNSYVFIKEKKGKSYLLNGLVVDYKGEVTKELMLIENAKSITDIQLFNTNSIEIFYILDGDLENINIDKNTFTFNKTIISNDVVNYSFEYNRKISGMIIHSVYSEIYVHENSYKQNIPYVASMISINNYFLDENEINRFIMKHNNEYSVVYIFSDDKNVEIIINPMFNEYKNISFINCYSNSKNNFILFYTLNNSMYIRQYNENVDNIREITSYKDFLIEIYDETKVFISYIDSLNKLKCEFVHFTGDFINEIELDEPFLIDRFIDFYWIESFGFLAMRGNNILQYELDKSVLKVAKIIDISDFISSYISKKSNIKMWLSTSEYYEFYDDYFYVNNLSTEEIQINSFEKIAVSSRMNDVIYIVLLKSKNIEILKY